MNLELIQKCINNLNFKFPYSAEEWEKNGLCIENYHKHTTWSDLVQIDSATSIDDFIKLSKEYGCKCYFSGEHGYQGEWLHCYDVCKKSDIKFRYSSEVYWVKDILPEIIIDENGEEKEIRDKTNCHMVIIARTYNAMRKLNYIITQAHDQGYYYKPRIDLNLLFTLSPEDVYITSACIAGWKYDDASEIWYQIWKHFGDSFFLEYQTHNTSEQKDLNKKISVMAKEFGIQTIIGLDTHYINDEDRIKRDNLLKRKKIIYDDEQGWYMDFPNGEETYRRMIEQGVLSEEEIITSMLNTHIFINGCEELEYNTDFKIPILDEYKQYNYDERCKILKNTLMDCYSKEDNEHQSQERIDGINYEYGEIIGSGTADYFLSNHKLVDLAINKYNGQLTTTSRGSASSYYCSKLLGFTTMDRFEAEVPIYPERFITKDRVLSSHQMPDIDLNLAKQEPFVLAAKELFGENGCYPLLAVGKLGEKSGFKLYADIQGLDPTTANNITTMIDEYNEAKKNADDDEKDSIDINDYITDSKYRRIFEESKPYQGIIDQAKVHACGHLIFNGNPNQSNVVGFGDIRYEIGLIRCKSESTGNSTLVVNAEGGLLDSYGYVKDDFLIVDVVGLIWKMYHSINREVPSVAELRKMVTGDEKTWDLYAKGITCCLNQCEKPGTTHKAMAYKPQNIKELAAFIAGIRPGFKSLINGFLNRVEYTNGEQAIDDLLEECFRYMLYQEAVMKIFSWLGIPMKDSYDTIKKISKKKLKGEALKHVEDTLREHWLKNIGNLDNFEPVYQVIKDSARYSFNAPHALAMANDSLYEAWFKAHYPSKFYEVTMNHYQDKDDKNKVRELQNEAISKMGYKLGDFKFRSDNRKITVDDQTKVIYPNLATIKHINETIAEELYTIKDNFYSSFFDLLVDLKSMSINSKQLDILIKLDFFEEFGDINHLLYVVEIFNKYYGKKNINKEKIDADLYDILKRFSVSETEKMFRFDNEHIKGLIKYLELNTEVSPCSLTDKIKYQLDLLGYIDYVNPELDAKYVLVTKLDDKYSPKFQGYCLKNGQTCELRVSKKKNPKDKEVKTTFTEVPFKDGDILYMNKCKKKPKQKKTDSGWEIVPGEFNWWITDYSNVSIDKF